MTNAQAMELIGIFSSNAIDCFAIYITVTFGYLLAAYTVGSSLTKYQVYLISALYSVAALGSAGSCIGSLHAARVLIEASNSPLKGLAMWDFRYHISSTSILLVGGVIGCLYFMYERRKSS